MPPPLVTPFINGHRYSFASIELQIKAHLFVGFTSIRYGSSLEPGEIFGTDGELVGRTRGTPKHHCEITMLRNEWNALLALLGPGFGMVVFDVIVTYDERSKYDTDSPALPEGVTTDKILGARISNVDTDSQEGNEAVKVDLTLKPTTISHGADDRTIDWREGIDTHLEAPG